MRLESKQSQGWIDFLDADPAQRYLLGLNEYSRSVARHFSVAAFVESSPTVSSWCDLPVVALGVVPSDAIVLVCSGGRPRSALREVRSRSLQAVDYFSFHRNVGEPTAPIRFNQGFDEARRIWGRAYDSFINRLEDDLSRDTVKQLLEFRATLDMSALEHFQEGQHRQYFEPFLELGVNDEVFFDVGAFDGSTSQEFLLRCPGYREVVLFEPDSKSALTCAERFKGMPRLSISSVALSDRDGPLGFNATAASTSSVSRAASATVQGRRLDSVASAYARPTLVKIDVEGHEEAVLSGGHQTLGRRHVRLAVSMYHSSDQFFRVPLRVADLRPSAKLYVRHYTESIYETILFAIG